MVPGHPLFLDLDPVHHEGWVHRRLTSKELPTFMASRVSAGHTWLQRKEGDLRLCSMKPEKNSVEAPNGSEVRIDLVGYMVIQSTGWMNGSTARVIHDECRKHQ